MRLTAPDDGFVDPCLAVQALPGRNLTPYERDAETRPFCYVDDMIEGCLPPLSLPRRHLLALTLCAAARPAMAAGMAVPPGNRVAFTALRNGKKLGTHALAFQPSGRDLAVSIAVDYLVMFGPVALFRYTLRASEAWRDGLLMSVRSKTDNDGTPNFMNADREGDRMRVDGSKTGRYLAPAGAIASSHWNQRELDAPMINAQDGELLDFKVASLGPDKVPDAGGAMIPSQRFALTGPAVLDLWYSESGVWSGLRAVAKDGSIITYQPG